MGLAGGGPSLPPYCCETLVMFTAWHASVASVHTGDNNCALASQGMLWGGSEIMTLKSSEQNGAHSVCWPWLVCVPGAGLDTITCISCWLSFISTL
jgi:hypothetical protein